MVPHSALHPPDHPDRAATLSNFAAALQSRFERTGVLDELDLAVAVGRQAVDISRRHGTPAGGPVQAIALSNLGAGLRARFEKTGVPGDMDEAVDVSRRAAAAIPTGHPSRAVFIMNLGAALRTRFERTGAAVDLDESIAATSEAVAATGVGHPIRGIALANLAGALRARFERTNASGDLAGAVDAGRQAVDAVPAGHPDRAGYLVNHGVDLRTRFELTGALDDLNAAVGIQREAVNATPAGLDQAAYLASLGASLLARFTSTGVLRDLDEAVDASRRAAAIAPIDHHGQAVFFLNLGAALQTRFERTGAVGDLDASMAAAIQAVAATGIDHPEYAGAVSNFSMALRARFEFIGNLDDLDTAVGLQREAVDATPEGHPDRAAYLSNLGTSLRARFERTKASRDLDEAVDVCRRAVDATPAGHTDRAGRLSGFGTVLAARFEQAGVLRDLDEAVAVHRAAVDASPVDHPDRTKRLGNLGYALRRRFEHTTDAADIDNALSAYVEAARVGSAQPSLRIAAARTAAVLAVRKNDRAGAADLLETAVRLLPELAPRRLRRPDQQVQLSRIAGLANDAAAMALADPTTTAPQRAERALALLEAGRAVLLSQSLETRGDLTDLRQAHPDLAARFVELRDHLDQDTSRTVHTDPVAGRTKSTSELFMAMSEAAGRPDATEHAAADRIGPAEEMAATLRRIRSLDGFATFGSPPTVQELLAEAADGPVVTFNVTSGRCDALILTSDRVTSLELPGLTEKTLIDRITAFHHALGGAAAREVEPVLPGLNAHATVNVVLEWLWDTVTGPVLDHLGIHHAPPGHVTEWPRIWWAPGGRLGLLPLHAAGHHTDPDTPRRRTVMDRVVSSYTPTIRALRHARRSGAAGHPPDRSLIIAMPTTPGLPGDGSLPHVREEAEILGALLPGPLTLIDPPGGTDAPTARRVLDELPFHAIVHFACHGTHDPAEPAASRLLLHDHAEAPLTVAHLAPVNLDLAQLAYLSACDTALNTADVFLDEAIHLTSAFQLAGFPHVIGTLWALDDEIAVEVANRFYLALRDPGTGHLDVGRAAYALHEATRSLRDRRPGTPSLWAAHLHSGA